MSKPESNIEQHTPPWLDALRHEWNVARSMRGMVMGNHAMLVAELRRAHEMAAEPPRPVIRDLTA